MQKITVFYSIFRAFKQDFSLTTINKTPTAVRSHMPNLALLLACCLLPNLAFAAGLPFDSALQSIVDILTGSTARLIAIIAVAGLGIAALGGYLSMRWAIMIVVGLTMIFGAAEIVDHFKSA